MVYNGVLSKIGRAIVKHNSFFYQLIMFAGFLLFQPSVSSSSCTFIPPSFTKSVLTQEQQEAEYEKALWLKDWLRQGFVTHDNKLTGRAFLLAITTFGGALSYYHLLMPYLLKKYPDHPLMSTGLLLSFSALIYGIFLQDEGLAEGDILAASCCGQNPISLAVFGLFHRFYFGATARLLRLLDQYEEMKDKIPLSLQENFANIYTVYQSEPEFSSCRKELFGFVVNILRYLDIYTAQVDEQL